MADKSNVLATIEAQLNQAMQRKAPRQQTVKFELDGQVRACCLSKPFTYTDLLKSIQSLFGGRILASIDSIRCAFSRDNALRLPITNDNDLSQALTIWKSNGSNKLTFIITRKKSHLTSRIILDDPQDDSGSLSDDGQALEHDKSRSPSPPPGIIAAQKRRTAITTSNQSTVSSNEGGFFIPESGDDTCSSSASSVASRESSETGHSSRRRLAAKPAFRRTISSSSDVSGENSAIHGSESSKISSSSSEILRTQCFCSAQSSKSPETPTNWKLGRQLGQGAFGKVFLCYDVDTGRELAIKQIPIRGLNSQTSREVKILECEINVYKQLDHERIVRYHGAMPTDEYLQIFMEYMTGGSVRDQILNYGALTEQLTKKYTRQILEGLVYLHEKRYIHRDIKCANILRDISGNIKLGDFGTSRQLIAITNQNQPDSGTIGTAHWTAPEIIQGSVFGRKADIWSLGCTIVEMFTTGPPWQHLQPIAAIFHIVTCDKPVYTLPDNVSNSGREFIDACLTKDYNQRPAATDLIHHPFVSDSQAITHHNCEQ